MDTKSVTAMSARRITIAAATAIALFLMVACCKQPSGTCSAITNEDVRNITAVKSMIPDQGETSKRGTATNEAAVVQQKAAEKLGIPVEKILPKSGIVLRLIPAGTFTMGSPVREKKRGTNEQQHKVTLKKAFYLGKYEVTQGQYMKVMGNNPSKFKDAGENAPVESVRWDDCTNFMAKLAVLEEMPKGAFRLPTEAEWEYACRAGTQTVFCYGDCLDSTMANFSDYWIGDERTGGCHRITLPAGQFEPNAWGLYDMDGNVCEWCADWYGEYKEDAPDPRGTVTGSKRVVRGGHLNSDAFGCRSAYRRGDIPGCNWYGLGFRLCMPAGQ